MYYRSFNDYEERTYQPPMLQTNRSMWKLMILNILTLGLYNIVFFVPFSYDLDKVDPKRERGKTVNFILAYIASLFTFSIVLVFWHYHISVRVEEALSRRNISYSFSAVDFWLWYFLGSFILVGPFVYFHKLCKAMNLLCESYNESIYSNKR